MALHHVVDAHVLHCYPHRSFCVGLHHTVAELETDLDRPGRLRVDWRSRRLYSRERRRGTVSNNGSLQLGTDVPSSYGTNPSE